MTALFLNGISLHQSLLFRHLLLKLYTNYRVSVHINTQNNGKRNFYLVLYANTQVGERILCRHPFNESKRAYVVPQRVEELLKCYWPGISGVSLVIFDNHLRENSIDCCPSLSIMIFFIFYFLFFK